MTNPWTGKGNPYNRNEVMGRLRATLARGESIIAAGAGTGISAKFLEKGGVDLIIVYNSGRYRMAGHGSTAGLMAYGDANAIAMEIGIHNGTLAIYIALNVLNNSTMSIPPAIYSLLMFFTAAAFGFLVNMGKKQTA
jgi:predicted TIM-barrel enzyme